MTAPRQPRAPHRRSLALALALCGVLAPPAASAPEAAATGGVGTTAAAPAARAPASPRTRPTTRPAPTVGLAGITPSIATPGQDVVVQVRVANTSTRTVTPLVRVRAGSRLTDRADVAEHLAHPQPGRTVVRTTAPSLMPGTTTTVPVTLPAAALTLARPYGVLPLTITVDGLTGATPVATFLPYAVVKEYEPLRLAVALPVTADPDPALITDTGRARSSAWTRMLAPGSRLDRVLTAAERSDADLVIDPTVADHVEPSGPTTSTTSPSTPAATGAPTLARRLRGHDIWRLPPGDPDISALTAARSPDLHTPATAAPAAPTVSWPAGTSDTRVRNAAASGTPPNAILLDESRADTDPDSTGDAVRTDAQGHRVLAIDDVLSDILGRATSTDFVPALAQRALAESVTLLAESPGRRRTVLVLPDRGVDPDPNAVAAVTTALTSAPWVTRVGTSELTNVRGAGAPVVDPATTPTPTPASASPITAAQAPDVRSLVRLADGLRPTVGDDNVPTDIAAALVSTRWRGHTADWTRASTQLHTRLTDLRAGVRVVPSTINFFAEHGALQVTVVNDLPVDVHDVHLTAAVRGNPRLRVLGAPAPLTIRAHSRATVRLDVEAVAAGVVPVTVSLRTPTGTPLGEDATVSVRVRPTSGWIVLAGGGVVGVVFLFGLFRAIRAGERRVAARDLRGLDLD